MSERERNSQPKDKKPTCPGNSPRVANQSTQKKEQKGGVVISTTDTLGSLFGK